MKLDVKSIQLVLFINSDADVGYEKLSIAIKDAFGSFYKFSGPAMFFPEAPGLPPEIPRMVLQSVCEDFKFQLSRQRADIMLSGDSFRDSKNILKSIFEVISQSKLRTSRIGYNKNYEAEDEDADGKIRRLLSKKLDNVGEIFIRFNDKGLNKKLNLMTNNVVSVFSEKSEGSTKLRISFDYNSAADQDFVFFEKDFSEFIESGELHANPNQLIKIIEGAESEN